MPIQIIGGARRGAKLNTLEGEATRPLRARIRESLFNMLREHVPGARAIDAFAGSGAVGLEALSRGAEFVAFVEAGRPAQGIVHGNIRKLRYERESALLRGESPAMFAKLPRLPRGYSLVFLMPSYHSGLCTACLDWRGWEGIADPEAGCIAVCETHAEEPAPAPQRGWQQVEDRLFGITRLTFWHWPQG
jgi:16S rRNA (guanine966-N2)-methyltransferase